MVQCVLNIHGLDTVPSTRNLMDGLVKNLSYVRSLLNKLPGRVPTKLGKRILYLVSCHLPPDGDTREHSRLLLEEVSATLS